MTTYTVHADSLFDPDKPILGITSVQARDNLIAVTEGASGAPKVDPINAMQHEGDEGAIGTYVMGYAVGGRLFGETIAGSALFPSAAMLGYTVTDSNASNRVLDTGSALSGTWRCMGILDNAGSGSANSSAFGATLWLRIA